MRNEEVASWDWGKGTWGGREKGSGTVPVVLGAQEARMGCWVKMAGKWVRGYCLGRWGLEVWQNRPLGFVKLFFVASDLV
nr:hypothetical protein [Tanacetum cinerariifolium]